MPAWIAFSVVRLLEEHFPGRSPTSSPPGWRTCSTTSPGASATATASSAEFYYGSDDVDRAAHRWSPGSATSTPASSRRSRRRARRRHQPAGRPLRALPRGSRRRGQPGRQAGQRARRPAARRADPGEGARAVREPRPARRSSSASHPETGLPVVAKNGRFGPYVTELLPEDAPRSGPAAHRLAVQVDDARHDHPRRRGQAAVAAAGGRRRRRGRRRSPRRTAATGRTSRRAPTRAPSTRRTSCSRSPSTRRSRSTPSPSSAGAARPTPPLKELGNDPVSGQPIVVKAGRFGEYVTDGEYNATLRKDDTVESITLERAAELLAERREKGPAKKTAKKAAKKDRPRRPPRRRPRRPPPRRPEPARKLRPAKLAGRRRDPP